jgi:hypothetical protein
MKSSKILSFKSGCAGILASAVAAALLPDVAAAASAQRFMSVQQCRATGRLPGAFCAQSFDAAKRTYAEQVRRFPTRDACRRYYATCVVYLPFPFRRLDPRNVQYAPPFLGIAVTGGTERGVAALVGVERASLGVTSRGSAPAAASRGGPEPEEAATAVSGKARESLTADPLPGDVLTFPVPRNRLPKRIPDLNP